MKKIAIIFILILFTDCTEKKSTISEQVTAYYDGFKIADFSQIKRTLADSLITIHGDYTTAFSHKSYYEKFKWDSVFKPVYKLVSIENQEKQAIATITVSSLKHKFLKNNSMTCRYKFYFKSEKISKIEELDCPNANWEIWGQKAESLVNWVQLNHPELDGFIYDLSMKGAIDYVHAINLYEQRQIKVME